MSTILLVEDDVTSREMLVHRLVSCGFQVLQAGCAADAEEMVLCCLPDLILLDITLPDKSGLEVLKVLKGNSKTATIPVIIVSGRTSNDDIINGLNMGASDYITKPYQWGIINARIKSSLRSIEVARLLKEALYHEKINVQNKSDFLVNMSHEIRTPLNGILGVLQLMKTTALSDEQEGYLKLMDRSGTALTHIINGLLDFSKIEAGHLDLISEPFNLEDMLVAVSEIIYPKACQKELELFINIEPGTGLNVIGDEARLSQIITNYASNALKFTETGCITFHLRANQGTEKGTVYHFEVEDTGIGLSTEAQKKLFQKFIQADPSISQEYGGTGLGLSICKDIAEAMSGHVGMFSKEGEGTKFWVEIPMKYDESLLSSEEDICLEGKNILIAGSTHFCSNYLDIINRNKGFVSTAIIDKLGQTNIENFDLIITSDTTTYEQCKSKNLPVIIIHDGINKRFAKEDPSQLQAPLKTSDLLNSISSLLNLNMRTG
ncbi:MAG: ATP-binding protein [Lentisphaerales bacterium]|nr:ATP-binding protein [Lentisphaerales bacterium]